MGHGGRPLCDLLLPGALNFAAVGVSAASLVWCVTFKST